MSLRCFLLGLSALALSINLAAAQPPQPPPPAKYQATIRYRIVAARDTHVALYDKLISHLQGLGFEFQPPLEEHPNTDRENPNKNLLEGLIAPDKARLILDNPSVASVLLVPAGAKLPDDPAQLLTLRLELAGGLPQARQRELADQVLAQLQSMGWREAVGFDHRGYTGKTFTRLIGTLPAGRLVFLLRDLRLFPGGWLNPSVPPAEMPLPLRSVTPIRIIEVLADPGPEAKAPQKPETPEQQHLQKIEPRLLALTQDKAAAGQTVRLEMFVVGRPSVGERAWKAAVQEAAPEIFIENQLGQLVTALAPVNKVAALAALPEVLNLRLPRPMLLERHPDIAVKGDNAAALKQAGLDELHKKGFKGRKVKLALLDHDFRGWEEQVKAGKLPAHTHLVDLSAAYNPDLQPLPYETPDPIGHGTHCALAAALAAPEAELILVRLPAFTPAQLVEVAQLIRGNVVTETLIQRRDEIDRLKTELLKKRADLLKERREILEDFTDDQDERRTFGLLGAMYGWIFSDRDWHFQRMAHQKKLETDLDDRVRRFLKVTADIRLLQGVQVAACTLSWPTGYPQGGSSPVSQWFDRLIFSPRPPGTKKKDLLADLLWFQSAGNNGGQAWSGYFRDEDGNGVLEFLPADQSLPLGRWSRELNFLAWRPYDGTRSPDLPAGLKLRLSMQWREPHDPDYYPKQGEDDLYFKPLALTRLVLLRQRDPQGKSVPGDFFEVVARSAAVPQRLEHHPGGTVYERALEVTIDQPGRYAVRLEKLVDAKWLLVDDAVRKRPVFVQLKNLNPPGIRPGNVTNLPTLDRQWEMRLRLFVETEDEKHRRLGQVIFGDVATAAGTLSVPADAPAVFSVGAVGPDGKVRPYSASGPSSFAELAVMPRLYATDNLALLPGGKGPAYGASLATAYAAGTAAALLSAGVQPDRLRTFLQSYSGKLLKVN